MHDTDILGLLGGSLQSLGEGDRRVRFSEPLWSERFRHHPDVRVNFTALHGGIRRSEAISLVNRGIEAGRYSDAFVLAMVWGHGPSNYGAFRTGRVLAQTPRLLADGSSTGSVTDVLKASADLARRDFIEIGTVADVARDAYGYLNSGYSSRRSRSGRLVNHLGPSFFTKWLALAAAEGDCEPAFALPILDEIVIAWWRHNVDKGLRSGYTTDYVRYATQVNDWARRLSTGDARVSPLRVEEAIFESATGRTGEDPRPVSMDEVFVDLPV